MDTTMMPIWLTASEYEICDQTYFVPWECGLPCLVPASAMELIARADSLGGHSERGAALGIRQVFDDCRSQMGIPLPMENDVGFMVATTPCTPVLSLLFDDTRANPGGDPERQCEPWPGEHGETPRLAVAVLRAFVSCLGGEPLSEPVFTGPRVDWGDTSGSPFSKGEYQSMAKALAESMSISRGIVAACSVTQTRRI